MLARDQDDCWQVQGEINWHDLPARVEGVIEAQMGKLNAEQHAALVAAAVEGEEFTYLARLTMKALRHGSSLSDANQLSPWSQTPKRCAYLGLYRNLWTESGVISQVLQRFATNYFPAW